MHVFFDVDGVLIDNEKTLPTGERIFAWTEFLERDFGLSEIEFAQKFIHSKLLFKVSVGELSVAEGLSQAFPEMQEAGRIEEFITYWLEGDSKINAPVLDIAKALNAQGVPVYLATQQEERRAAHLMNTLSFKDTFQDIFYSGQLGLDKKDPAFFEEIKMRLSLSEDAPCIMIDDTLQVLHTAEKAGFQTIHYKIHSDLPKLEALLSSCRS